VEDNMSIRDVLESLEAKTLYISHLVALTVEGDRLREKARLFVSAFKRDEPAKISAIEAYFEEEEITISMYGDWNAEHERDCRRTRTR